MSFIYLAGRGERVFLDKSRRAHSLTVPPLRLFTIFYNFGSLVGALMNAPLASELEFAAFYRARDVNASIRNN